MTESILENNEEQPNSINYIEFLSEIWRQRKFIAWFTGSVTLLTIIILILLPNQYTSTAVILPDVDKSRLGALGSLSDIAAIAGVNIGGEGSLAKLYPTIIKSESVLKNVIYRKYKTEDFPDSVNLIQFWEIKEETPERDYEEALKKLQKDLTVSAELKTNVVTMSIETRDARLSADILNAVIEGLNEFILTKRTSNASEQRKWIEKRLVEVKRDLEKTENALKEFREKNRIITGSPQLMLEQARLERELQINNTLYIELKKQQELARIEEVRTTPIITVMDYARPAAKKSSPKRGLLLIIVVLTTLLVEILWIILTKRYQQHISHILTLYPWLQKVVRR